MGPLAFHIYTKLYLNSEYVPPGEVEYSREILDIWEMF